MRQNLKKLFAVMFAVCIFGSVSAHVLISPNGNYRMNFRIQEGGIPTYDLYYKGNLVIATSRLGFELMGGREPIAFGTPIAVQTPRQRPNVPFYNNFSIINVERSTTDYTWETVWGEERFIRNHYNELAITLQQAETDRILIIRFRMFDTGLGFRYEFPSQPNLIHFALAHERTEFAMTGDHTTFWIPGDYNTAEYDITISRLTEIRGLMHRAITPNATQFPFSETGVQTPLLMRTNAGIYISIHEAALINYAAMHLELDDENLVFHSHLTPCAIGSRGFLQTPAVSPWRTIIVTDDAREILSSRIVLNLNEPNRIEDTSWIRPMKYIGIWWTLITGQSSWYFTEDFYSVQLGITDFENATQSPRWAAYTANVKRHIDFAARHGFCGVLVEGWNIGWEDWFGNWKDHVFDFLTPYPGFDVVAIRDYAAYRGVSMIMHHETSGSVINYERHLERAYRFMNEHNYPLAKTGYVGDIIPRGEHHTGQFMVNHFQHALELAAQHQIMLNVHEHVRPTGQHRTWPNLLATESARGNEYQAFGGSRPTKTTILPFTRLIGGPMDFTPGIFENDISKHNPNNDSWVNSTLVNQLSLYVTMSSPLQMAADIIDVYKRFMDAFQFIIDVALDWEQSVYLEARPGEYITVARQERGGTRWFVGSTNGYEGRNAQVNFSFLPAGETFIATIYADNRDAHFRYNPQAYNIRRVLVTNRSRLSQFTAPGGGLAISLEKVTDRAQTRGLRRL